jgi:hypothetical protein
VQGGPHPDTPCVIPPDETKKIFEDGHGTTPDLVYAGGMPAPPDPDLKNFNKMLCTLIPAEVAFCRDIGCYAKLTEKTEKYSPLVAALKKYWGKAGIVAIPIGHTGTILRRTLEHLTTALYTVCPHV